MPRTDTTLDAFGGSVWFSTLDLQSGYWQVEMNEKDKEKTAFTTGDGLWQFTVMPFGLCNAPATFERLMDQVLACLPWEVCLVYLDDIIIHAREFEEAISRLREVFLRLRIANLKLNARKCQLFAQEVRYLGHIIGKDGIATDPEKVKAVQEWPVPWTQREVRSFLGLCTYYRRFVPSFASIAKPLHRLTEKLHDFEWTTECQVAFEKLIEVLPGKLTNPGIP